MSYGTMSPPDAKTFPVRHSPSPWTTKSECYWLILNLKELPDGVYDPLEASDKRVTDAGDFKGGLGFVMIVRYANTPVGPYDELILIPGNFMVPHPSSGGPPKIPKKALRIARIYVSQRTTTFNGRVNWNIPKHLARFKFSAPPTPAGSSPPTELDVKVFPPGSKDGDGVGPFFSTTIKPWRWVPSMPFSSKWVPLSTEHAQPPIPKAELFQESPKEGTESVKIDDYDINPQYEHQVLPGTEIWNSFVIDAYSPRTRGCWVTVHKAGDEDAVKEAAKYFPQDLKPWSFGAWLEDADMIIPKPLEWKL